MANDATYGGSSGENWDDGPIYNGIKQINLSLQANGAIVSVLGPYGGSLGENWDDGSIYDGVQQINLSYAEAIGNFNAVYDLNGSAYPGPRHYAGIGPTFTHETVKLNYPNEYITSVEGYCGPLPGTTSNVVRSLSFKTNTGRTYGPYGVQQGTAFTASGTKIVGFIGRTGFDYLEAIGLYKTT